MGYTTGSQGTAHLQASLDSFRESMRRAGIRIGQPSQGSRSLNLRDVQDHKLEEVLTPAAEKLDLLYIILPAKHTALYNRIKHICDVKVGIMNICSVGHKLVDSPGRLQYFGNVALKLNLKAGGDNQQVDPPRLHFLSQGRTMIFGIDVTHPSPNSSKDAPRVAAVVGSTDAAGLGRFSARSLVQEKGQEMLDPRKLKSAFGDLLHLWKTEDRNANFPENIIVFRDGVSDGQHRMVRYDELLVIRGACSEAYDHVGQPRPRVTVVIVTKRHHTRFGPITEGNSDGNGNCVAGTVTDRGITEVHRWDFYKRKFRASSLLRRRRLLGNY
jgi:eukaryotic translation initiation factor 2C